jgi:hypothetical protein
VPDGVARTHPLVKTILETRQGCRITDPNMDQMRAALAEPPPPGAEYPETWLEDGNGWSLVVFESGHMGLLGPDSKEVCVRRRVSREEALKLWCLMQEGRRDEIVRRLSAFGSLKRTMILAIAILSLSLLYCGLAAHDQNDPVAMAMVVVGFISMFAGYVLCLLAAKQVSLSWFLACLILGCLAWPFFCVTHFSSAWKPLIVWIAGLLLAAMGLGVLVGP